MQSAWIQLKRSVRNTAGHVLLAEFRESLRRLKELDRRRATLEAGKPSKGNVLLSYIIDPFFVGSDDQISQSHTNHWESLQMARTFQNLGYDVDVISYQNFQYLPDRDYRAVVDVRSNLERLSPLLPSNCKKIAHLDTAHWMYQNATHYQRLLELQQRRRLTLSPRRITPPNQLIEHADVGIVHGNDFTLSTFASAGIPLWRVPLPAAVDLPWPEAKNWENCRKSFLFLNSGGMVHKGLDLVLEAFAKLPELRLTVCCPVSGEKDFEKAFSKELYHTSNIRTLGWLDLADPKFQRVAEECVAVICPSCSEGQSGSVITAMHASVIPIVSRQSGVDVGDFGVVLDNCSISSIQETVHWISLRPARELAQRARSSWEWVRANHTRRKFAEVYLNIVDQILHGSGAPDSRIPDSGIRI